MQLFAELTNKSLLQLSSFLQLKKKVWGDCLKFQSHKSQDWNCLSIQMPIFYPIWQSNWYDNYYIANLLWLSCIPKSSCAEILTPSTSEWDLTWRRGLNRCNQVKMWWLSCALLQYDWCPYNEGKFRDRCTQRENTMWRRRQSLTHQAHLPPSLWRGQEGSREEQWGSHLAQNTAALSGKSPLYGDFKHGWYHLSLCTIDPLPVWTHVKITSQWTPRAALLVSFLHFT